MSVKDAVVAKLKVYAGAAASCGSNTALLAYDMQKDSDDR
jgi:hypothetical protein